MASKVSKNIGIIYRLSHFVPTNILRILYCSLILPYLSYCNIVWANNYMESIHKLIILQKKVIRIITRSDRLSHTHPLFLELGLLKLPDINFLQQLSFVYDSLQEYSPSYSLFKFNFEVHRYNTRIAKDLHLPQPRLTAFKHSIRYTGPLNWNDIPSSIKDAFTKFSFIKKLKSYLISNYQSAP